MFLRPQHFQQHDRYLEAVIDGRSRGLQPFDWGFDTLAVDPNLLALGKLALSECRGIFPDGTPFHLPEDDELPLPLDLPEDARNSIVYLALPLRRHDQAEFDSETEVDSLARYRQAERKVRDNTSDSDGCYDVHVGKLRTRLMLEGEERSGYCCLGVARVVELRADKTVELDKQFIAPALNSFGTGILGSLLRELQGILQTRGEALSAVVTGVERLVAAEASHLLALQVINRYQPLLAHYAGTRALHPEDFYRVLLQLAGELSTFYRLPGRRPSDFPAYKHDDLQSCIIPLVEELRQLLLVEVERHAFQIPLANPRPGAYVARRPDPALLDSALFVLAVKAQHPPETVMAHFPNQVKIAPVEEIQHLINQALPGIAVRSLPHVPQHIPRHAGFCYFELDKHSPLWRKLTASNGFAIHIGGNFPGLELEFWATTKT